MAGPAGGEKVDGHIDIDLDVEKLEGKSGSATYAEIKAYFEEKYGFNVTSLYIKEVNFKSGDASASSFFTLKAEILYLVLAD